jgi:hypothetical protein
MAGGEGDRRLVAEEAVPSTSRANEIDTVLRRGGRHAWLTEYFDSLRDFREAEGYAEKTLFRLGKRTIFELIEMAKNILQSRRHAIVKMPEFLEALSPPKLVAFVLRVERPPFFQKYRELLKACGQIPADRCVGR